MRAILATAVLLLPIAAHAQLAGHARAVDGDTIEVAGERIRLWGIDAAERSQMCSGPTGLLYGCGEFARDTLAAILRGRTAICERRSTDRYGRTVATCSTEAGDIGAAMVRQGQAIDYERYSHGRYAAEQAEAKAARRGVWSGRFDAPETWRRAKLNRPQP